MNRLIRLTLELPLFLKDFISKEQGNQEAAQKMVWAGVSPGDGHRKHW